MISSPLPCPYDSIHAFIIIDHSKAQNHSVIFIDKLLTLQNFCIGIINFFFQCILFSMPRNINFFLILRVKPGEPIVDALSMYDNHISAVVNFTIGLDILFTIDMWQNIMRCIHQFSAIFLDFSKENRINLANNTPVNMNNIRFFFFYDIYKF